MRLDLLDSAWNADDFYMFSESDFGNDSINYPKKKKNHISSGGRQLTMPPLDFMLKNIPVIDVVPVGRLFTSPKYMLGDVNAVNRGFLRKL